jgi:hypothetical protein
MQTTMKALENVLPLISGNEAAENLIKGELSRLRRVYCTPNNYTIVNIRDFVSRVEALYNLTPGTLFTKCKGSNLPRRKHGEVNLSAIRKAIILHVKTSGYIRVIDFGEALGVDHSSIVTANQIAKGWLECEDIIFTDYYNKVKALPVIRETDYTN